MEPVDVLRFLYRLRLLVLAGAALAIAVGLAAAYELSLAPPGLTSRQQPATGRAVARLQLDMPPQRDGRPSIDEDPRSDIGILWTQSRLLADLLASEAVAAEIAAGAGIRADDLFVKGPSMLEPPAPTPLALRAAAAAATPREPFVVKVGAGLGAALPIVTIETVAPDASGAERLVDAAAQALGSAVPLLGAPAQFEPVVRPLGAPRVASQTSDSKLPLALAAMVVVFGTWCGALVIAGGVLTRLRHGARRRVVSRG